MTNTPRRVIKIKLSPRDVTDSPDLLKAIEAAFQNADLEIDIRDMLLENGPEPVEVAISTEALEATGDALDLNDQMIKQGMEAVPEPAEAESRTRKWLKFIREKGITVLAGAAARSVFEKVLDKFSG